MLLKKQKKIALFITVLGNSHYQLLTNQIYPNKPSPVRKLKILVERLEAHFQPQTIEVAEQHNFHCHVQTQGESVVQFKNDFKQLSLHCDFGESLDKSLRYLFITGLRSTQIKKVFFKDANLDFTKNIQLAQQSEAIERDLLMFDNTSTSATAAVNALHQQLFKKNYQEPRTSPQKHSGSQQAYVVYTYVANLFR